MSKRIKSTWEEVFNRKERALLDNDCAAALQISGLADLQCSLQNMATEYRVTGFPDIVNRLKPGFEFLDSFTAAITSASQYDPRACLVWGGLQAFVVAACQSQAAVDDMLGLILELSESLPGFKNDLEIFPDSPALHVHLQSIYDSYMDYCISSVTYMKRGSATHFLTYFFAFNPASSLKRTKEEIQYHMKLFERAAQLARQQKSFQQEVQKTLTNAPLSELPPDPLDRTEEDVKFPISSIRMFQNFTFLGRDQELRDIRAALLPYFDTDTPMESEVEGEAGSTEEGPKTLPPSKHGKNPACCVIQGLGGIGKTQTALQYSYTYEGAYDAIFWIRSDLESTLASSYSTIAKELGMTKDLGGHDGQNQGQAIERARQWLKTTSRKWLLIFDNVEDLDDLNIYFPRNIEGEGAVIITTQKLDFFPITDQFTTINLKSLDREYGAELMFRYLRREPKDEEEKEFARKISDLLGGLPLALATIGGYIEQTDDTVFGYYESLKTSSSAWEASAIGPAKQYEKTLATVFAMALQELPEDARMLIDILAYLSPDQIPEDLFTAEIGKSSFSFLSSRAKFVDTIRMLRRRQLVRRDTTGSAPYISIHRTVQWAVLHDLSGDNEHRRQVYLQAFDLVRSAMPQVSSIDNPEPELWSEFEKYVPQILHLRAHCLWPEPPMALSIEFAQVLSDMATYMWHAGLLAEGTDAMRTAEDILDYHNIGDKDPLRSNIHQHIGIFASHCGVSMRDEAMSRRAKAIASREASHNEIPKNLVTREDEIRRWNVVSDLAFGLLQGEDFVQAGEVIERCHAQYKLWGPPEEIPFEYLKYNHIVSYVHMAAGRPLEAIRTCKEGAALGEICCGLMHPMTQHVRCSLANHLFFGGEIEESLKENLSVLRAREKIVGGYNHFTLESHSMCGSLYAKQEKFEPAEYHFLECLDPRKRPAWNKEGFARAQFLYADVLRRTGREKVAEGYLSQARETRDHFLQDYPQWLRENLDDELVVFDQMVCMWAGRYTGKLTQPPVEPEQPLEFNDIGGTQGVEVPNQDVGMENVGTLENTEDQIVFVGPERAATC